MKILEKGPGWFLEEKCTGRGNGGGGCNSLLEVEKEDIYVTTNSDYLGDVDYYYTFKCPVCGIETDIPEQKISSSIKREALEKYKNKQYTYHR